MNRRFELRAGNARCRRKYQKNCKKLHYARGGMTVSLGNMQIDLEVEKKTRKQPSFAGARLKLAKPSAAGGIDDSLPFATG